MYYGDFFEVTWKAFSDHPVIYLKEYDGKRVSSYVGFYLNLVNSCMF